MRGQGFAGDGIMVLNQHGFVMLAFFQTHKLKYFSGLLSAFHRQRFERYCSDVLSYNVISVLVQQDLSRFGQDLQTLCQINRITDGCVVEQFISSHVTDDGWAGSNANSKVHVLLWLSNTLMRSQRALFNRPSRTYRAQNVVFLLIRAVPDGQHRIAHEFIQGAFFFKDGLRCQR